MSHNGQKCCFFWWSDYQRQKNKKIGYQSFYKCINYNMDTKKIQKKTFSGDIAELSDLFNYFYDKRSVH